MCNKIVFQTDVVDLGRIDERIGSLTNGINYNQKRKESIRKAFSSFLKELPHKPCLLEVSPHDVVRFLVWKDKDGKTQIHDKSCSNLGKRGIMCCECPLRLASGSVENIVLHITDLFQSVGLGRVWNEAQNLGNPATSEIVKKYIKAVQEEQAKAHIVPKQAKPIFMNKLRSILDYIDRELKRTDLSLKEKFTLYRDQAMFKVQFFAGDRASDVAIILSQEVKKLDDNSGFVFNHTFGKTLRGSSNKCNTFVLKRCKDEIICPVHGLESYYAFTKKHGVSLKTGYLFRIVSEDGKVLEKPMSYSSIYERFKGYLLTLGIFDGETPHSMRAGCAILLAHAENVDTKSVMNHIGWKSERMAHYYTRASTLKDSSLVANGLAKSALSVNQDSIQSFFESHSQYDDLNPAFD